MKNKQKKTRVLFPIGAKLVFIISILLLASLVAVILMVSGLSTQEVQKTAEENNFTVNHRAASQTEGSFKSVQTAALLYLAMADWTGTFFTRSPEMERYFFNRNQNIAAIWVNNVFIPNMEFFNVNAVDINIAQDYLASDFEAVQEQIRLFNASAFLNMPLITAVFIRQDRDENETVKVLFTSNELAESFGTGTNTSFLINSSGDLLLHPDSTLVMGGANFSSMPIVEAMQQHGDSNRQISYTDEGTDYFGAYYRIAGTDAAVITSIPHNIVFEAVRSITRQNLFLAAAVLFITIIFIWFFSKTISRPVRTLAGAALQIEEGEFDLYLKPNTRDELGLLTESFDNMTRALNVFGRFTNKDIAIRAMRGEIKPGGLPKHATIFFSDIRGFTEKTENFTRAFGDDAPNRLVLWLNDYYTQMINCVEKTGGVVDKFIGDAMMAHWGTAFTAGSIEEDACNCINAALMMRNALVELNARRAKNDQGNPVIHIGCGINTGMVIAGQIGSEQRMEYTVVGDSVNLTSRVESLNKTFGTDILITENTLKLIGDRFITEEMLPVKVKGMENPVRLFAVINKKDSRGQEVKGPSTLAQVRTLLGIEAPEISESGIVAEEPKYAVYTVGNTRDGKTKMEKTSGGPSINMTSFDSTAWVQGLPGKPVPVFFSWNTFNFNPDTHIIVEVAEDRNFKHIIANMDVIDTASVSIPLKNGMYWWRVYPANGGSCKPAGPSFPCGVLMVDTYAKEKVKIHQS